MATGVKLSKAKESGRKHERVTAKLEERSVVRNFTRETKAHRDLTWMQHLLAKPELTDAHRDAIRRTIAWLEANPLKCLTNDSRDQYVRLGICCAQIHSGKWPAFKRVEDMTEEEKSKFEALKKLRKTKSTLASIARKERFQKAAFFDDASLLPKHPPGRKPPEEEGGGSV